MSLTLKLAARNLSQDRLRFIATIIGIVFSIVLVTIQLGLFLSFRNMVTEMIDHAQGDLWIVPVGTKCFEDPSLLDAHDRDLALGVPGVDRATPLLIGFSEWTLPSGGVTPIFVVGSDVDQPGLHPWNVIKGDAAALARPDAVAVDQTYFSRLGVGALGDTAEIREQKADIVAVTNGIRSFTTTPYVFASLAHARDYLGVPPDRVSYVLLHLAPKADVAAVKQALLAKLSKVEVLTPAQFAARGRSFWLFGTGAGAALFAGALLGAIVGTVIVAQTLYSSTKDHLGEFATLRAIGSSSGYIHKVIICQALISAAVGFAVAALIGVVVVKTTAETSLPVVMTPGLEAALFLLTAAMCVISAIAAIVQVLRIDPAVAFRQ